ncbi:M20 family metallopeptidase [Halalkalibacillus halophilus]|uniref:M20 family metallopeptidase n=1 Tax=Halalkalibacillus halophilus TaxID=392827 RepID=UPI000413F942|nr:M20 family metallopeptidase [Halalkalibacillus halophilus]
MIDIVDYLKHSEKDMLQFLEEIVRMESPSQEPQLTAQLADYLTICFEKMTNGKTSRIHSEEYTDHIRAEWGEGENQLLILTHLDTVWPQGTLETMPFEVKDGKAYGPGSFDMKAGIVQAIYAIQALETNGVELDCKIVLLITSDEELGSPTSKDFIIEEAKKSEAVFVLEPSQGENGALKTARKGVGTYDISIKGISSHAGIEPEKGASAIEELAEKITYLSNLTDLDKGTSVNVGIIDGGSSKNVIAEEAHAVVDVRVQTQEEMDRIAPLIEELKPVDEEVEIQVEGEIYRPPLERTDEIEVLFEKARDLAKTYLDLDLEEESTGGGSDANFTASIAATLDGLGAVGDGAHANHEHVIISQMPRRSALLAMLLCEYGKVRS